MRAKKRLRDFIYNKLMGGILLGGLTSGGKMWKLELAKKYKMSRTPIREALCPYRPVFGKPQGIVNSAWKENRKGQAG